MKKYLSILFITVLFAGTSCEEKIDIESEKDSIKETIVGFFKDRSDLNFEGYIDFWMDDPDTFISYAGKDGYSFMSFDELKANHKGDFDRLKQIETEEGYIIKMEAEDISIKVYEENAWAHCKNQWTKVFTETNETEDLGETFLIFSFVKQEGDWKIDFLSAIVANSYNKVTIEE